MVGAEGLLQGVLQGDGILGGDLAGAGAAVEQVVAGLGEGGKPGPLRQGQGVVPVQQQRGALGLDLLAEFLLKGHQFLLAVVVAGEMDGGLRVGDDLLGLGVQGNADDRGKLAGDGDGRNAHGQQNRRDRRQGDPAFARFLFHAGTPFQCFTLRAPADGPAPHCPHYAA